MKYVILKLDEIKQLYNTLTEFVPRKKLKNLPDGLLERFNDETGADIEEIARELKNMDICCPCKHEGQESMCKSIHTRKLGRRLYRLLERANYQRK